jgi:hypothetical protein
MGVSANKIFLRFTRQLRQLGDIRSDPPRLATLVLIRVSILRPEEPNRTTGWPSTYPRTDFQKYSDPNERTPKITPT